jgi:tetratricopeptide (TPR) repeat protein
MKKYLILFTFVLVSAIFLKSQMADPVLKTACGYIKENKINSAIEILKKDLKFRPWNHDVRLYLGLSYYLINEKDLALEELKNIEKQLKKMLGDARRFGDERMFLSMGMERKDRGVFSPENEGLFNFCYGIILKEKGKYKEAEKKLKEALKKDYNELKTRFQLLDLALKKKEFSDAKKELKKILKLSTEDEKILFIKSYILAKTGKPEQAIDCLNRILSQNSDNLLTKKNLGRIYYNEGNYQKAVEIWSEILDKNPEEKNVIINMGRAYFHLGKKEKAQEMFEQAGIKISAEKYSPKKISLIPPEFHKKIEFDLTCK